MSATLTSEPLLYQPSFEVREEGEDETTAAIIASMLEIGETTYKDYGKGVRTVHAKSHGLLQGQLEVLAGLPPALAQGLFAKPGHYPVYIRLSTTPGDLLDDHISTPRGLALKVMDVEGARVAGSAPATTQDFVMVNGPAFAAPTAKGFLKNLKLLASTTDKAPGLKKALSAVLRTTERALESVGGKSTTLSALGGHPLTNILGETFYTQVPMLYGPYMAKLSIAPISPELTLLKGAKIDLHDRPDGIRDAVVAFFDAHAAQWELRVQLCTNLEQMPIEDASKVWPEEASPYIAVARITAPMQPAWNASREKLIDEGLAFNPWHCLADHRPLGSVMRVRQAVYEASAALRARHNNQTITEPTGDGSTAQRSSATQ